MASTDVHFLQCSRDGTTIPLKPKKDTGIEITAVILLTVGRAIINNLAVKFWLGDLPVRPFGYFQFTECLRGIFLAGLVLFVVWLKKESWTEIGLTTTIPVKDLMVALLLIFTTTLIWILFASTIESLRLYVFQKPPIPFASASTTVDWLWICVTAIIVGFGEELLIRGYLLSCLLRVCRPLSSVIYSSLVFSVWHISQGLFMLAHTFIWGLVYGWTFIKIRRLYPFVLAHAINNVIAYLWT